MDASSSTRLSYLTCMICGSCAGIGTSLVVTPMDRIKIICQVKKGGETGPWKQLLSKDIVSNFKSLYTGVE